MRKIKSAPYKFKTRFVILGLCMVFNVPVILPIGYVFDSEYKVIKNR